MQDAGQWVFKYYSCEIMLPKVRCEELGCPGCPVCGVVIRQGTLGWNNLPRAGVLLAQVLKSRDVRRAEPRPLLVQLLTDHGLHRRVTRHLSWHHRGRAPRRDVPSRRGPRARSPRAAGSPRPSRRGCRAEHLLRRDAVHRRRAHLQEAGLPWSGEPENPNNPNP